MPVTLVCSDEKLEWTELIISKEDIREQFPTATGALRCGSKGVKAKDGVYTLKDGEVYTVVTQAPDPALAAQGVPDDFYKRFTTMELELARLKKQQRFATVTSQSYSSAGNAFAHRLEEDKMATLAGLPDIKEEKIHNYYQRFKEQFPQRMNQKGLEFPNPGAKEKKHQPVFEVMALLVLELVGNQSIQISFDKYIDGLRPDGTLHPSNEAFLWWRNSILHFELETNLLGKYHQGLGQASTYSTTSLLSKGDREFILGGVLSLWEFQLFRIECPSGQPKFFSISKCELLNDPLPPSISPGLRLLFQLFSASPSQLGYLPAAIERVSLVGQELELTRSLGAGANSHVFEVEYGGKKCAIKLDSGAEGQPFTEAEVLQELNKAKVPGVPKLLLAGMEASKMYHGILMEPSGTPLSASIADQGFMTHQEASRLAVSLILILKLAHKKGYCHGDVRPPNVIFHDGNPFLIDWGLAMKNHTNIHGLVGVVDYASSNVLQSECQNRDTTYTIKDDLESLLYLIWSLMSGLLPWSMTKLDAAKILTARSKAMPPHPIHAAFKVLEAEPFNYEDLVKIFKPESPIKVALCTAVISKGKREGKPCSRAQPCQYHRKDRTPPLEHDA